jgi:hypothetical protein
MTKKTAKKTSQKNKVIKEKNSPPELYKRDSYGLLESVEHYFNEDGSVDWRSMIKPEFLYPNKGWFDARKKEMPKSIDGLKDNQLLIMLGGIKELARLRGFQNVKFKTKSGDNYVTAKCTIKWMGNYESNNYNQTYEDVANATSSNTDSFCVKFLETIACNRAFVRCVRNYLNIHIVGADEIDKSPSNTNESSTQSNFNALQNVALTPNTALEKAFFEKSGEDSFSDFKTLLRELWKEEKYRNDSAKDWSNFSDIPPKESRKLLAIVKNL